MLRRLRARYPNLRLHVIISKSMQIERDAENGDIDIGLAMSILDGRGSLKGTPVRQEALAWIAGDAFEPEPGRPMPLLALPPDCSLQRFIRRLLELNEVPYVVAHSASGIAGLQSALVAGLGVSCLNTSAVPSHAGERRLPYNLPALPKIEFSLLPPRPGEAALVGEVRDVLAMEFA